MYRYDITSKYIENFDKHYYRISVIVYGDEAYEYNFTTDKSFRNIKCTECSGLMYFAFASQKLKEYLKDMKDLNSHSIIRYIPILNKLIKR